MKKTQLEKRAANKKWFITIEENVKKIYNYDKQCIQFLEKYDIAERKFM